MTARAKRMFFRRAGRRLGIMNVIAILQAWMMALLVGGVLVAVAAGVAFGVGARVRRGELTELVTVATLSVMALAEIAAAMR